MYITTKLPATNTRGARIRATDQNGRTVVIPYPHELDGEDAHLAAVNELRKNHVYWLPLAPASILRGYAWAPIYPDQANAALEAWASLPPAA